MIKLVFLNKTKEYEHALKVFFFDKIKLFTGDDKFLQHRLLFTLLECGTIYCILYIHGKNVWRGEKGKEVRNETVLSFCVGR